MSCACENRKMASDLDRIRRLAKAFAKIEGADVAVLCNSDGTYSFQLASLPTDKTIVEYVTPY